MSDKRLLGGGEQSYDTLLDRILVLLQPSSDGVMYDTSIMLELKVGLASLYWLRFAEVGRFSKMVGVELLLEGVIRSFGYNTLLLENGEDTQRLEKCKSYIRMNITASII